MPLSEVLSGKTGIITGIDSGKGIYRRLASMGVFEGREISIISNNLRTPVLIESSGRKMAIGRGMAAKIQMEIN
jgi:ferrous iron transport protein A